VCATPAARIKSYYGLASLLASYYQQDEWPIAPTNNTAQLMIEPVYSITNSLLLCDHDQQYFNHEKSGD